MRHAITMAVIHAHALPRTTGQSGNARWKLAGSGPSLNPRRSPRPVLGSAPLGVTGAQLRRVVSLEQRTRAADKPAQPMNLHRSGTMLIGFLCSVASAVTQGLPKDRCVCLRLACKRGKGTLDEATPVRTRVTQ